MKTKAKFSDKKEKGQSKEKLYLNTTFERAMEVVVGTRKPTKNMVKIS